MGTVKPPPAWTNSRIYSYADNDSPSGKMLEQREIYDLFVFPEESLPDYIDYWGKDKFYGKVNTEGVAIIPHESSLGQLVSADGTLFALNFVADAWRDFTQQIRDLVTEGVLYEDSLYADPTAVRAWTSLESAYHDYIAYDVYGSFTQQYLSLAERDTSLVDVSDFLTLYYEFAQTIAKEGGPITLAGYAESFYNSPLTSGLAIEISDASHDNDFAKGKDFIGDPNFVVVARLAQQYGFLVDKNAPWRFVADLYSPAMFEYMVGVRPLYGTAPVSNDLTCSEIRRNFSVNDQLWGYSRIPGMAGVRRRAFGYDIYRDALGESWGHLSTQRYLSEVFRAAFQQVWTIDIERLRLYLYDTYERYRQTSPFMVKSEAGRRDCKNATTRITRVPALRKDFDPASGVYGYLWGLKSYYLLRGMEKDTLPDLRVRKTQIQSLVNYYYATLASSPPRTAYYNTLKFLQERYIGPVAPVGPMESPETSLNILGPRPYTGTKESKY